MKWDEHRAFAALVWLALVAVLALAALGAAGCPAKTTVSDVGKAPKTTEGPFTKSFAVNKADLVSTGSNPYFSLEPGSSSTFAGVGEGKKAELTISVLAETKVVDGVETRVVDEHHYADGKLIEVSRNYFAIDKRTNSVYYFGEDSREFKGGKEVSRKGSWTSGDKGARFGLFMPGTVLLGARYYQEVAPGVALDRAEIVGLTDTVDTPVRRFTDAVKTAETTPLEPGVREFKYYVAGVGLVRDGNLLRTGPR